MSTPVAQPGPERRAIFQPGGFSRHEGPTLPEAERLRRLTGVFLGGLFRGALAKLGAAAFFLPAVGVGIYVVVRGVVNVEAFAVPHAGQTQFLLDNMSLLFGLNLAWLLLVSAARVAPLIARDAWHGALLLYFSRPVHRSHYLFARCAAPALAGTVLLLLPALLLLVVHLATFGVQLGGMLLQGWLATFFWLGAGLALTLASASAAVAVSLVALGCSVVVRNPSGAPLLFGGGILGSVAVSWVLQAAWGRDTAARAFDLHHALRSVATLALAPLSSEAVPRFALVDAAVGASLWAVLAAGAWWLLQRFLADPPLGKGRAG